MVMQIHREPFSKCVAGLPIQLVLKLGNNWHGISTHLCSIAAMASAAAFTGELLAATHYKPPGRLRRRGRWTAQHTQQGHEPDDSPRGGHGRDAVDAPAARGRRGTTEPWPRRPPTHLIRLSPGRLDPARAPVFSHRIRPQVGVKPDLGVDPEAIPI